MIVNKIFERIRILPASVLKLLACALMLVDHVGVVFFPTERIYRIIGRLAFPIFAYFIAEGCKYTRNRLKRFLLILIPGILFEAVYVLYAGEIEGNVLLTFSLSILLIYALGYVKRTWMPDGTAVRRILALLLFVAALVACGFLSHFLDVDYGFPGVLVPVIVSLVHYRQGETAESFSALDCHPIQLLAFTAALLVLVLEKGTSSIQIWCLLSVPLMMLYSGKPGTKKLKYLFYIFYPAHLLILEGLYLLINR